MRAVEVLKESAHYHLRLYRKSGAHAELNHAINQTRWALWYRREQCKNAK